MVSGTGLGVSRRSLLTGAGAGVGVGAVAIAGCTTKPKPSNVPLHRGDAAAPRDAELLAGLLAHERYAIAAYAAGIPLLSPLATATAQQFLSQELAHATELEGLIRQAGFEPAKPPAFYDLGRPRTERDVLELLHRAEQAQLDAYLSALAELAPPRLRAAMAAILANDAQHAAVVRQQLGLVPVPGALVSGLE